MRIIRTIIFLILVLPLFISCDQSLPFENNSDIQAELIEHDNDAEYADYTLQRGDGEGGQQELPEDYWDDASDIRSGFNTRNGYTIGDSTFSSLDP